MIQTNVVNAVNKTINNFNGKRIAMPNGKYEGECTAPVVWYLSYLGLPIPPMAHDRADGWGTNFPPQLAPYFTHENFKPGKVYPEGTILMWNSPHIAFVISSDGDSAKVFEQNADPDGASCHIHDRTYNNSFRSCTFALIPKIDAPKPPAPKPAPAPVPAPSKPVVPANTIYTKLAEPLSLQVNKSPTHKWDLGFVNDTHATTVQDLAKGTEFVAVGKAQRTDGDRPAYFMDATDFGNADQTGIPAHNCGINTIDLSPKLLTTSAPANVLPETLTGSGESIPVTVTPTDPNKWQQSYTGFLSPQNFIANKDEEIDDLASSAPIEELKKGSLVVVAGTFDKDGYKYYRTVKSVQNEMWYGLPVDSLVKQGDITDDELDQMLISPPITSVTVKPKLTLHQKLVATVAVLFGTFTRIFRLGKKVS